MDDPTQYVWQPGPDYLGDSPIRRVMNRMQVSSLEELHRVSVVDPERYWAATMTELDIRWSKPYQKFVEFHGGPQWPRWFVGGRLNIVDSAVGKWVATRPDADAIVWHDELGQTARSTFGELAAQVRDAAAALRAIGVGPGDRVGIFAPMCIETAVGFLAVLAIGAVAVPMFSGYPAGPVATRLRDSEAVALLTATGFTRRGRLVPMREIAAEAVRCSPTVRTTILIDHSDQLDSVPLDPGELSWTTFVAGGAGGDGATRPMDPNDPALLIYTSGTTGRPKGTVHYHAGVGLKMAADLAQLTDLDTGSISIHWSDFGWIVGPGLLLANLIVGATSVINSGAPDHPAPEHVWELVAATNATHLWLPPTLVRRLRATTAELLSGYDLGSLRVLCSTGEPWDVETYRWYAQAVGGDRCPISNYAGGTEIGGGILGCVLSRPIKAGSFNFPVPGMAANVVDDGGEPITGKIGELVIERPFVGMTQGFWRDPERYLQTYWSALPGVWVHGDWARRDADGYWFIHGRSDDTIKVSGRRIGPGDIETIANGCAGVSAAAAIGVPEQATGSAVVLIVMPEGDVVDPTLVARVGARLGESLDRASFPIDIQVVRKLPLTRTGKLVRRVVRAAYLGLESGDLTGLEDASVVDQLRANIGPETRSRP
jgi:acetyl-CoA synthetase